MRGSERGGAVVLSTDGLVLDDDAFFDVVLLVQKRFFVLRVAKDGDGIAALEVEMSVAAAAATCMHSIQSGGENA